MLPSLEGGTYPQALSGDAGRYLANELPNVEAMIGEAWDAIWEARKRWPEAGPMRRSVRIAGSRDIDDRHTVAPIDVRGAGSYPAVIPAGEQRRMRSVSGGRDCGTPVERYPADWDKHGKAAATPMATRCWSSTGTGLRGSGRRPQKAEAAGSRLWT